MSNTQELVFRIGAQAAGVCLQIQPQRNRSRPHNPFGGCGQFLAKRFCRFAVAAQAGDSVPRFAQAVRRIVDNFAQGRLLGIRLQPRAQGLHLHRDTREPLEQRVVQFPCDACPFVVDRACLLTHATDAQPIPSHDSGSSQDDTCGQETVALVKGRLDGELQRLFQFVGLPIDVGRGYLKLVLPWRQIRVDCFAPRARRDPILVVPRSMYRNVIRVGEA